LTSIQIFAEQNFLYWSEAINIFLKMSSEIFKIYLKSDDTVDNNLDYLLFDKWSRITKTTIFIIWFIFKALEIVDNFLHFTKFMNCKIILRDIGISCKSFAREIFKCFYLSLFIIIKPESLILFKLNKLMVAIKKKPTPPTTTNPVWKI
jgi:hypothetical protein